MLVWNYSCWSRNAAEFAELKRKLREQRVDLVSATESPRLSGWEQQLAGLGGSVDGEAASWTKVSAHGNEGHCPAGMRFSAVVTAGRVGGYLDRRWRPSGRLCGGNSGICCLTRNRPPRRRWRPAVPSVGDGFIVPASAGLVALARVINVVRSQVIIR